MVRILLSIVLFKFKFKIRNVQPDFFLCLLDFDQSLFSFRCHKVIEAALASPFRKWIAFDFLDILLAVQFV